MHVARDIFHKVLCLFRALTHATFSYIHISQGLSHYTGHMEAAAAASRRLESSQMLQGAQPNSKWQQLSSYIQVKRKLLRLTFEPEIGRGRVGVFLYIFLRQTPPPESFEAHALRRVNDWPYAVYFSDRHTPLPEFLPPSGGQRPRSPSVLGRRLTLQIHCFERQYR